MFSIRKTGKTPSIIAINRLKFGIPQSFHQISNNSLNMIKCLVQVMIPKALNPIQIHGTCSTQRTSRQNRRTLSTPNCLSWIPRLSVFTYVLNRKFSFQGYIVVAIDHTESTFSDAAVLPAHCSTVRSTIYLFSMKYPVWKPRK